MISLLTKLLNLLALLASAFKLKQEKAEADAKQTEADSLSKDPGNWFRRHFGGLRNDAARPDSEANKTDTPPS